MHVEYYNERIRLPGQVKLSCFEHPSWQAEPALPEMLQINGTRPP